MKPKLFDPLSTSWDTQGYGVLFDALRCEVTEVLNGEFELELDYPIFGKHFEHIFTRSIILAKPNMYDDPQPFRVYESSKPLNGIVTFYARHLSYDLDGIPCQPFSASSLPEALLNMKSAAVVSCPFTFETDKTTLAAFTSKVPEAIRSLMSGQEGSILDVFRGEYAYDKYRVRLLNHRGTDRGFSIRYGKNLTNIKQEENIANCYTGVYPYWSGTGDNDTDILVQLQERIVSVQGDFGYTRIKPLDLSSEFESAPTEAQLRNAASRYITDNDIGVPHVSITVSFVLLGQTEEYSHIAELERVELGDTVGVCFAELGISAQARCTTTVYDVLRDRYKSVGLGDARNTLERRLAGQQSAMNKMAASRVTEAQLQRAIANSEGRTAEELRLAMEQTATDLNALLDLAQRIEDSTPILITGQPQSVTVSAGTMVTIPVTAEGEELTYQWYALYDGEFVEIGNTSNTFIAIATEDTAAYCVISDKYGNTIQTATATITVEE